MILFPQVALCEVIVGATTFGNILAAVESGDVDMNRATLESAQTFILASEDHGVFDPDQASSHRRALEGILLGENPIKEARTRVGSIFREAEGSKTNPDTELAVIKDTSNMIARRYGGLSLSEKEEIAREKAAGILNKTVATKRFAAAIELLRDNPEYIQSLREEKKRTKGTSEWNHLEEEVRDAQWALKYGVFDLRDWAKTRSWLFEREQISLLEKHAENFYEAREAIRILKDRRPDLF